jgi:pimeloyl-ACP methyl ester carboxylesterase
MQETAAWAPLLSWAWRVAQFILLGAALLWLGILALLWTFQRNLLYPAPQQPPGPPPAGYRLAEFQTSDGLTLGAWYRPSVGIRPTIAFFSGNAASRPVSADWCQSLADAGFGLLILSYRGYDRNPGAPSEQGLYRDARAALAWLAGQGVHRPLLAGLSLGSGVAVEMAYEAATQAPGFPAGVAPAALLLFSPYRSIPEVAAGHYPFFPVRLLARDRFDSEAKIAAVGVPVFVAHGDADAVIPYAQGQAVWRLAPERKQFETLKGIGHDYNAADVLPALEAFLARLPG